MDKSHAMPAAAKTAGTEKKADLKLVPKDDKSKADDMPNPASDAFPEFDEMWDNLPV